MRTSSLVCIAAGLTCLLLLLATTPAEAARKWKDFDPTVLLNPLLGPDHAQWLVGPIARIADRDEVEAFLGLTEDEAARSFIEDFWAQRSETVRSTFEQRCSEADQRYTEGAYTGCRSDRGTVYVLYGDPAEEEYDIAPYRGGPPVLVWRYDRDAEKGLDGKRPKRSYRFIREGDLTTFFKGNSVPRQRLEPWPDPPQD